MIICKILHVKTLVYYYNVSILIELYKHEHLILIFDHEHRTRFKQNMSIHLPNFFFLIKKVYFILGLNV